MVDEVYEQQDEDYAADRSLVRLEPRGDSAQLLAEPLANRSGRPVRGNLPSDVRGIASVPSRASVLSAIGNLLLRSASASGRVPGEQIAVYGGVILVCSARIL